MKIYIYSKKYNKETKDTRNSILAALYALYDRIYDYEKHGTSFEQIFNDDKVKYDQQGSFYVYKSARNNLQLRILYSYFFEKEEAILLLMDYHIKKKNNKDYIREFEYAKELDLKQVFQEARMLE